MKPLVIVRAGGLAALLLVAVGVIGACGVPPEPPTAVKPLAAPACGLGKPCAQAEGECASAVCRNGECQLEPQPARTRCTLTPLQARYQNAHQLERNEAGVCRQGVCIPRMQCAELCGAALGPELWRKTEPPASACSSLEPMQQMQCRDRIEERPELVELAQEIIDRCLLDCGFPDVKEGLTP